MANTKVLLVDDDEILRFTLKKVLELNGFEVTAAGSVAEALKLISSNVYEVLLSDPRMPGAGDGLTVVSAMHHANPKAVTILLSGYPHMDAAADAIVLQADQILVKPMSAADLVDAIKQRIAAGPQAARVTETVATILERSVDLTIQHWYSLLQKEEKVMTVAMSYEERCGHLPQVFKDLVDRLRSAKPIGSKELVSPSAMEHGINRRKQGYTAAMLVEESRMLQVSVFQTLQNNLLTINFSVVLISVMTIADGLDSQLSQAMASYIAAPAPHELTLH